MSEREGEAPLGEPRVSEEYQAPGHDFIFCGPTAYTRWSRIWGDGEPTIRITPQEKAE